MTSAQHIASHVAAHTRSLGADLSAGYTVMSLYAAGFVAYVAAAF
jgi:hypothetical protein